MDTKKNRFKEFKKVLRDQKGFTMIELIIVISILAFVVAMIVPVINTNFANIQKQEITSKLMANFAAMEGGFNNYLVDKNAYPSHASNLLSDTTFVPSYLMPPKAPDGFDSTYGLNGYLMFYQTTTDPKGYYICAKANGLTSASLIYQAIKDTAAKLSASKFFYNTTCPSASNMTDPASPTTVYTTYWITRF